MKKIFMTLSLALAAMIALPAVSNAQDAKPAQNSEQKAACCKEESKCCNGKEFKKGKKGKDGNFDRQAKMRKGGKKGMQARRDGNPLFKGITLSEAQQEQVKALKVKQSDARKASKADMKAKSREEMKKMRADFDKEMEKILDKDQMKQYKANQEAIQAKRADKGTKEGKRMDRQGKDRSNS